MSFSSLYLELLCFWQADYAARLAPRLHPSLSTLVLGEPSAGSTYSRARQLECTFEGTSPKVTCSAEAAGRNGDYFWLRLFEGTEWPPRVAGPNGGIFGGLHDPSSSHGYLQKQLLPM